MHKNGVPCAASSESLAQVRLPHGYLDGTPESAYTGTPACSPTNTPVFFAAPTMGPCFFFDTHSHNGRASFRPIPHHTPVFFAAPTMGSHFYFDTPHTHQAHTHTHTQTHAHTHTHTPKNASLFSFGDLLGCSIVGEVSPWTLSTPVHRCSSCCP